MKKQSPRVVRKQVTKKQTHEQAISESSPVQSKPAENPPGPKQVVTKKIVEKKIITKKIIEDKKLRGEWAESVFMARATEYGLAVSKPWGEMSPFDFIIGKTGRFVSVQVKSTMSRFKNGYDCTVRSGHKAYAARSFDFLAAYAVPDDAWYIIPADLIHGKESVTLFPHSRTAKYEPYREAWHLLRDAVAAKDKAEAEVSEPETADADEGAMPGEPMPGEPAIKTLNAETLIAEKKPSAPEDEIPAIPRNALERMQAVERYVRKFWGL